VTEPDRTRASDAEREAVVEVLKAASVEGRLTLGELTERTEAAYSATTRAELDAIVSDLPAAPITSAAPEPAGKARRWFVAVLGDTKRRGTWRADRGIGAVAVLGDVLLDLRQAEVRGGLVDIVATAVMGDVEIIVPDGVSVELDGIAIMGDKRIDVQAAAPGTDVPVIRVKAYALMGDIKIIGDSRAGPAGGLAAWRERWERLRRDLLGELPPPENHHRHGPGHHVRPHRPGGHRHHSPPSH